MRWLIEGAEVVGRVSVRHALTQQLLEEGGHIGYVVAPHARGRGHAKFILRGTLGIAAELGIDPALVTCDLENVASARVIEANGGVLEDIRHGKKRYWVAIRPD